MTAPRRFGPVQLAAYLGLDQLTARPDIDWAAVRATLPGRRSPLAALAATETILATLAAPPAALRRRPR